MAQEVEIKLKVSRSKALLQTLKRLRARPVGSGTGRVHEWNVIFDTPQGGLAKHGQLLRIRTETPKSKSKSAKPEGKPRIVLTFKKPATPHQNSSDRSSASNHHKIREEIELQVSSASLLASIFEGLGMNGWFRYEKYRTTFRLPASVAWASGLLIELDETPIGTFLELEGPPGAIDRAAQELGFSRHDYIRKSYLALYIEDCRLRRREAKDMLFSVEG